MTFSFSYSRWSCWDECPAKYKYKHIDKLPEPKSKAMEKGIEVHRQVAEYIEGKTDERPASLRLFTGMADALRDEAKHDMCKVEKQVALDKHRKRVEWFSRNAYWRFIWDVLYNMWSINGFLRLVGCVPISPTRAKDAIRAVGAALKEGEIVCLFPEFLISATGVPFYLGGTSLLIVVSVTMDTVSQIQGHLLAHQYEGLVKKSKLRGGKRNR